MNTLNKLLDKSRELCGSDMATAARLGVTRSAVSKWRHGGKIEAAHLAKLITLTQQDPALSVQVLAEQEASPEEQAMWGTVWDRLSPVTTTVAGVLLMIGLWAPSPSQAMPTTEAEQKSICTLCAIVWRKLRAWAATMGRRPGIDHASPVLA